MNRSHGIGVGFVTLAVSVVLILALHPHRSGASGSGTSGSSMPNGWISAGSAPKDFDMGADHAAGHAGKACGFLKAKVAKPSGFGTLMQMCKADGYLGKRVRMSAWVRADHVTGWAGVWMRVDGTDNKMLAFDNMRSRPITGTQGWTKAQVVLDVAPEASALAFGILLDGPGVVWIDDVQFEVVDKSVATTGVGMGPSLAAAPQNLDFEK